jgi:hypothetical protein
MNKLGLTLLITYCVASSFAYYLLLNTSVAFAQTPTDTPTPTASQEIKEKVQERIDQIKENAKKKAFWGTLKSINDTTLVLDGPKGEKRIKTDDTTIFVDSAKKTIKISDLEIGNFIIAMGFWTENGTLQGKRISVLKTAPKPVPVRIAFMGKVTDIVSDESILSITQTKKDGLTYEVSVTSKTVLTKKVDGSVKKVLFSALSTGDMVVVIGLKEKENNAVTAKIIHVIPLFSISTPTPTDKLTPTPTKKATPTPTTVPTP